MPTTIHEEALIPGAPARVWTLVTDPRHFQAWYAFGGAEIDLSPGGAMTLRWDEHGAFEAVVEAVSHGERFSFRWLPEPGPLVTISLEAAGSDMTRVRIEESGALEDPAQSALAWRNGLRLLAQRANSDPRQ